MLNRSVQDIERILQEIDDRENPLIKDLLNDERKGVKQLLVRWNKKKEQEQKLKDKFHEMTIFENKYRKEGFQWIAGVDEVGRGPLAGPVIAAAVILPKDFYLTGIDDSKKLSENKRDEYFNFIQDNAVAIGIGIVEPKVIDQINIYEATKKAMNHAIFALDKQPEVLLIDAMKLETPYIIESIVKGDAKSISIAAASIIAKVTRDRLMREYANLYPKYKFETNMGYGTKEHLEAIQTIGITPIHRKSFAPIKDYFSK